VNSSVGCVNCPVGKYQDQDNAASVACQFCASGREFVDSSTECKWCVYGKYQVQNDTAAVSCKFCAEGTEFDNPTGTCQSCPNGKYQDQDTVSRVLCKFCAKGTEFINSSVACDACPVGKYQDQDNETSVSCKVCPSGKYSDIGSAECTNCPTGWVSASGGSGQCTDCDAHDQYNANEGQTKCWSEPPSGTNYITRLNRTTVKCQYGGTPVYLANGKYDSGCNSPEIVMFGRAVIKVNGVCANKCVKWYSTTSGSGLVDGFANPGKNGSFVIEVTDMTYCNLLWATTFNVPKSDECEV